MDLNKLKIGAIAKKGNSVIIGATFMSMESKELSKNIPPKILEQQLTFKKMIIRGEGYKIKCSILSVSVASSISDYKSIYFATDLKDPQQINVNDELELL